MGAPVVPRKLAFVVEDHADVREVLVDALTGAGFEVEPAADGLEAFQLLARRSRPDVLVVDLMMPVMDGWQLVRNVRTFPALADVPVVAISALHMSHVERPLVDAFVAKPFDPDDVVRAVNQVIATRPANR